MSIDVKKFVVGPIDVNTYTITNEKKEALIIDPSSSCNEVVEYLEKELCTVTAIVLTHCHFDHIMGIPEILDVYPGTPVYATKSEQELLRSAQYNGSIMFGQNFEYSGPVNTLTKGEIQLGSFRMNVLIIPGHSPEGCAIVMENYIFCGDILFAGSIGRSDFPGGDGDLLVRGINEQLMSLPETMVVCPGHGGRTSVGREKRMNPYLT